MRKSRAVLDPGSETPGCGRLQDPGEGHWRSALRTRSDGDARPQSFAGAARAVVPTASEISPGAPGIRAMAVPLGRRHRPTLVAKGLDRHAPTCEGHRSFALRRKTRRRPHQVAVDGMITRIAPWAVHLSHRDAVGG